MNDGIVCDSFARPIMEKIIEVQEEKQSQGDTLGICAISGG